ncbi:hypothetical protein MLD38_028347 [Melastoma candidum]|uniref:Uncharacterized protein n=1 Tax=Melastoma candidum TaxID=119954 RepID=A0ACB9N344_9MYRT|nr:hypothetical protein MLD38_028347 [Melastoma candidum]
MPPSLKETMSLCGCNLLNPPLPSPAAAPSSNRSSVFLLRRCSPRPSNGRYLWQSSSYAVACSKPSSDGAATGTGEKGTEKKKKLSEQSSWEAKDSEGNDYLYRLGKEADNMNIAVGARVGVIDDLFTGNFLGRDGALLSATATRFSFRDDD